MLYGVVKFHVSSLYLKIKQTRSQVLVYQFDIWKWMEVNISYSRVCNFV